MRIMITAGDPSADAHAARLMEAIRRHVPEVVFEGFGGPNMEMQGLHSIAHMRDIAVTGFWEVAKRGRYFTNLLSRCSTLLAERKPHLFIPVDYPGFNLRLAARAKAIGVPVAWYIAPQLWAWGKHRAAKLASVVDLLMVVFPFEVEYFKDFGINAVWVGHPFTPTPKPPTKYDVPSVVLMPGSRKNELAYHVPLLASTAQLLPQRLGFAPIILVPKAPLIGKGALAMLEEVGATLVHNSHDAMQQGGVGLIKAGTSTLEAALLNLPFATFYQTSWLSYQISKRLVNVQSITMMNLLLNRNVVHEFIQREATPEALTAEVVDLLTNKGRREEFVEAANMVRAMLGVGQATGPTAADRAATAIVERFL